MKTQLKTLISVAIVMVTVFAVVSCKKDTIPTPVEKPDLVTHEDDAKVEQEFDDAFGIAEDAMGKNNSGMRVMTDTSCATITFTPSDSLITVDFGTSGTCTGKDGRIRKGIIKIKYTGKYRTTGTKITTTFENYFVDGNKIEGTRLVENMGNREYKVTVTNAKITYTDGTFVTWNANKTRIWTAGFDTPFNLTDDEYKVNGTSSGVSKAGKSFTTTSTDMIIKLACWFQTPRIFYPVSGTKLIKNTTDNKQITVNFGSGTCDKEVTITLNNGNVISYILK